MSLNDIKINPQLLAGLYSDTLIETNIAPDDTPAETNIASSKKPDSPATIDQEQPYNFLGKNQKHILIVVSNGSADHLPAHELKFLTSILKACQLTLDDVSILNINNQPADYAALQDFFHNKVALLFAIEPLDIGLPMNFPQFQLQKFDKCTYLHAPALAEIEKQKDLKMKLWACLKNLFSL